MDIQLGYTGYDMDIQGDGDNIAVFHKLPTYMVLRRYCPTYIALTSTY